MYPNDKLDLSLTEFEHEKLWWSCELDIKGVPRSRELKSLALAQSPKSKSKSDAVAKAFH